ncbi:MAG: nuclear transport factor 2 family protein [Cytophagaceae bacterium]|nr:nuclear transport factor 2 family protein [Gemmatimonadaceae bacterium]
MHTLILAAVLLVVPAFSAHESRQPSDREAVRRAALDYIEGFYEGDSTKLMRSVRTDVFKYGYFVPRDSSRYSGEQMTWPEFLTFARNVKKSGRVRPATDPKDVQIYEVLDQTASARITAYWGIDYLLLAKVDGKWMITHVLWQTPPRKA